MNKRKLSIGLVSGLIGALALAGCGEVKQNDKNVVSFTGANGENIAIVTDDVYNEYRKEPDGIEKFYNAILETLVRYEFSEAEKAGTRVHNKSFKEIKSEAENNVKNAKNEADENHKTNNTSYDEEWEKILNQYGVEDEEGLLEYFIYQAEKSEVTDKFFNDNKAGLTKQYIGVLNDGKKASDSILGTYPYHIRHVLASISGGSTNYYNGTISQNESKSLSDIVSALLDVKKPDSPYNFKKIAEKFSGDSGSAAKGGDVGIMTTTTSFVNEFKLGVYAYDAIYGKNSGKASSEAILEGLGLDEDVEITNAKGTSTMTVQEYWKGRKLTTVPYGVFELLGEYFDLELDANGKQVNEGSSNYYPRNILWNQYLNHHDPFVITNEKIFKGDTEMEGKIAGDTIDGDYSGETSPFIQTVAGSSDKHSEYLADENGNIIIGVRSEHGIHFMITQKSVLEYDIASGQDGKVSLEEYYTTAVESDGDEYPHNSDGTPKATYVNYIDSSDGSVQTTRANEVKSAIKSFDKTYDYRLYKQYLTNYGDKIKFNSVKEGEKEVSLKDQINEYISRKIEKNYTNGLNDLNKSWKTYIEQIEVQDANRTNPTYTDEAKCKVADYNFRLIPTRCAVSFKYHTTGGSTNAWTTGGACYYAK